MHAVLELSAGLALIVASLALGLGGLGLAALFVAGVLLAGIGLGALDRLPVAVHESLDRWLVVGLSLASIVLALEREAVAALVLLGVAAVLLTLTGLTRWTRPVLR